MDEYRSEFFEAILNGELNRVKWFIRTSADTADYLVNLPDQFGLTALHLAGWEGSVEVAKALLEAGAKLNSKCKHYGTPLCIAALMGHEDVVEFLLNHKWIQVNTSSTALDTSSTDLGSALHAACAGMPAPDATNARSKRIIEMLLQRGADISAMRTIDMEFVKRLQENMPCELHTWHPNRASKCQPLHVAAYCGYKEAVELLCQHGAECSVHAQAWSTDAIVRSPNATPLMLACTSDYNVQAVQILLERQPMAYIDEDYDGNTAEMVAARYGADHCLLLLLESERPPYLYNKRSQTALMFAALFGRFRCVELLLHFPSKTNLIIRDLDSKSALTYARIGGNFTCIDLIESKFPKDAYKPDSARLNTIQEIFFEEERQMYEQPLELRRLSIFGKAALAAVVLEDVIDSLTSLRKACREIPQLRTPTMTTLISILKTLQERCESLLDHVVISGGSAEISPSRRSEGDVTEGKLISILIAQLEECNLIARRFQSLSEVKSADLTEQKAKRMWEYAMLLVRNGELEFLARKVGETSEKLRFDPRDIFIQ